VLIVEDDESLSVSLCEALRREGYRVDAVSEGSEALSVIAAHDVDLVLLDRDLPGLSGDAVCRILVATNNPARILMLTAADSLSARVTGLDIGADDYLTKPFAYAELLARMRALSRRGVGGGRDPVITRSGVTLDTVRRIAERRGHPLRLTPKEFAVLELLMAADGGFVTVDELLDEVWEAPLERTRGVVKVLMYSLRKKLGEPGLIVSEAGHGYRIP